MAHLEIPFAEGAEVWYSESGVDTVYVPCPDCAGTRLLAAIFGDSAQLRLPCETCKVGFNGSQGVVKRSTFVAVPRLVKLGKPSMHGDCIYYEFEGSNLSCSYLHAAWLTCKEHCDEMVRERTLQNEDQMRRQLASKRKDLV